MMGWNAEKWKFTWLHSIFISYPLAESLTPALSHEGEHMGIEKAYGDNGVA